MLPEAPHVRLVRIDLFGASFLFYLLKNETFAGHSLAVLLFLGPN